MEWEKLVGSLRLRGKFLENCFSDNDNFTMTQVKYLNAPSGS